jgi:hypothetical protein
MGSPKALEVAAVAVFVSSCAGDPLLNYRLEDPADVQDLDRLPCILQLPPTEEQKRTLPPTRWWSWDESRWFAEGRRLVGKSIDDVIAVFGEDYVVQLHKGRDEPRMYYHFAGTCSWGVFGVAVLDRDLRVKYFDTDPHCFENRSAVERYFGVALDRYRW